MSIRKRIPEFQERNTAIERLRKLGWSHRKIAARFEISHKRVQEVLAERAAKRKRGRTFKGSL